MSIAILVSSVEQFTHRSEGIGKGRDNHGEVQRGLVAEAARDESGGRLVSCSSVRREREMRCGEPGPTAIRRRVQQPERGPPCPAGELSRTGRKPVGINGILARMASIRIAERCRIK
ncbi:hypothetical protein GCM10010172_57870 [Paractinoplanes ferrugineus]|uniref:Uncharacterized protein n=1 Tax=Paractinoplanes ferrugineus TaxID=113564 RepID=A0A919JAX1_9ACTN|nr:hypothetical protein Afe05nite_77490 [Actinoplanes ferrugineus]